MELPSLKLMITLLAVFNVLSGCGNHLSGRPKRLNLVQPKTQAEWNEKRLIMLEQEYDAATNPLVRREIRDRFARTFIAVLDHRYNSFIDDIVIARKGIDASADITAIALDTASVLFTPATTKSILAGLSALTTASKSAFDKAYFYEQTLPVLISQMEADRQAVLADVHRQLSLDIDIYPLRRVLTDMQRYYVAGTIDGALEKIQRQAAEKAKAAEAKMLEQAEAEIAAARARHKIAIAMAEEQASFDVLKQAIAEWWASLDEDTQWEQIDVVATFAVSHQVGIQSLVREVKDGNETVTKPHPDGMGGFLDSLNYGSATHRLMLADIARNAAGLKLE